jgi:SAM-dependent methyltransferase
MTSTSTEVDFKAMGIYVETPTGDRVGNELREMQKEQGGDSTLMTPRDVYLASSMHYLNDEPLEQMNKLFNLEDGQAHRILDFGAGYAGDARIFANERTSVTCVEIQKHIHTQAQKLTDDLERSGTLCKNRVFHENIDITKPEHYLATTLTDTTNTDTGSDTTTEINSGKFDHAYSMLVILHIENRSAVFSSLKHHLKPGGDLYIEDFYAKGELSEQDKEQLAGPVACPYVPSKSRYLQVSSSLSLRLKGLYFYTVGSCFMLRGAF